MRQNVSLQRSLRLCTYNTSIHWKIYRGGRGGARANCDSEPTHCDHVMNVRKRKFFVIFSRTPTHLVLIRKPPYIVFLLFLIFFFFFNNCFVSEIRVTKQRRRRKIIHVFRPTASPTNFKPQTSSSDVYTQWPCMLYVMFAKMVLSRNILFSSWCRLRSRAKNRIRDSKWLTSIFAKDC